MFQAAKQGNVLQLREHLKGSHDINQRDSSGKTALHLASTSGHLPVAELLLNQRADANATDKGGKTPLHWACLNGHLAMVELLLATVNVDATDNDGWTVLHFASSKGHLPVADLLLGSGATVMATEEYGRTALHMASSNGHLAMSELLLSEGADPNATDQYGRTPLHRAVIGGHFSVAELLLANGADPKTIDKDGRSSQILASDRRLFDETVNSAMQTKQKRTRQAEEKQRDRQAAEQESKRQAEVEQEQRQLEEQERASQLELIRQPDGILRRLRAIHSGRIALMSPHESQVSTTASFPQPSVMQMAFALQEQARTLLAVRSNGAEGSSCSVWASEMAATAVVLDAARGRILELVGTAATGGSVHDQIAEQIQIRDQAAEEVRTLATKLLGSGRVLAGQQSRLETAAASVTEMQAVLPIFLRKTVVKPHLEQSVLPELEEGAGSVTALLLEAWSRYTEARVKEKKMELAVHHLVPANATLWESVGKCQQATESREAAALEVLLLMKKVETEHAVKHEKVLAVAHGLAAWCNREIQEVKVELAKQESLLAPAIARADALLHHVEALSKAQGRYQDTQADLVAVWDCKDEIQYRIGIAKRTAERARRRGQPATGAEQTIAQATLELKELLASTQYRRVMAAARSLQHQMPEIVLRFPALDPFFGTAAQSLPLRDLDSYSDVHLFPADEPFTDRQRELLKAKCPAYDDETQEDSDLWCVLKCVDHCDEKRLQKEMAVLASFRHPNILPLQGVCKQSEPLRYFAQVPLHPCNLKQHLAFHGTSTQSREERNLWIGQLLKGVLEGISFLHQMGITHCDLKPENVLISETGQAMLADFNTSKNPSSDLLKGIRVADSDYAAPEVLLRGAYSKASDIFSFGMLLAHALGGQSFSQSNSSRSDSQLMDAHSSISPSHSPSLNHSSSSTSLISFTSRSVFSEGSHGFIAGLPPDRVDAEQKQLLRDLLHEDPSKRPSAEQLLQMSFFKGRPVTRECCVCLVEHPLSDGLECAGGGDEQKDNALHFTCRECMAQHVDGVVRKRDLKVHCPMYQLHQCKAPAFSDGQIALFVAPVTFTNVVGRRLSIIKADEPSSEMEKQTQASVAKELQGFLAMDAKQRRIHTAARRVCELLTDGCPRCDQVFDFNGCCSVQCSKCPCSFCAWCLADCGTDAHRHVAQCSKNLAPGQQLFASATLWQEGRIRAKREAVAAQLREMDAGMAKRVTEAVSSDLQKIGLSDLARLFV